MICHSRNAHLGDLIWTLIMLSKLPGEHALHCAPVYHDELRGLVEGLPIAIEGVHDIPQESLDCWIASGQFEHRTIHYDSQVDIIEFVMRYMNEMCLKAGHQCVFEKREDMLCDFPSINDTPPVEIMDALVINSDPKSGQCDGYSSAEMDALIEKIRATGKKVVTVQGNGFSLVEIGRMSLLAELVIGCATGPFWTTLNTLNSLTPHIVMLEPQRLNYGSVSITHAANAAAVEDILKGTGWL